MHASRTVFLALFALLALAACRSNHDDPRNARRRAVPGPLTPQFMPARPQTAPAVEADVPTTEDADVDAGPPVEGCIHEHGGCRRRPQRLPECAADVGAMAVGDVVTNRARMVRQRVSVFGRLAVQSATGSCTERGCPPTNRCCNRCTTEMVVAGGAEANAPKLLLVDADHASTFTCEGDVSEMCCPYAETTNVVVLGTVAAPTAGRTLYTLMNPTICEIVHPRIPTIPDAAVSE